MTKIRPRLEYLKGYFNGCYDVTKENPYRLSGAMKSEELFDRIDFWFDDHPTVEKKIQIVLLPIVDGMEAAAEAVWEVRRGY